MRWDEQTQKTTQIWRLCEEELMRAYCGQARDFRLGFDGELLVGGIAETAFTKNWVDMRLQMNKQSCGDKDAGLTCPFVWTAPPDVAPDGYSLARDTCMCQWRAGVVAVHCVEVMLRFGA